MLLGWFKKILISTVVGRYLDAAIRVLIGWGDLLVVAVVPRVSFDKDSYLVFALLDGIGDNVYVLSLARDFYLAGYKNISFIVDRRQADLVKKIEGFEADIVYFDKQTLKSGSSCFSRHGYRVAVRTNPSLEHTLAFRINGVWKDVGFIGSYKWFSTGGSVKKIKLELFDPRPIATRYNCFRKSYGLQISKAPLFTTTPRESSREFSPKLILALDKSTLWDMPSTIDEGNLVEELVTLTRPSNWSIHIVGERKTYPVNLQDGVNDLRGETSLEDLIDLVSSADLVVSTDNGVMHISAMQNRDVAAIFTFTSPIHFSPPRDHVSVFKRSVACAPCTIQKLEPVNNYVPLCSYNHRCRISDFEDLFLFLRQKIDEKNKLFKV